MTPRGFLAAALLAVALLVGALGGAAAAVGPSTPSPAGLGGHYLPEVGDRFAYTESVLLTQGAGNYTGYTEATFTNGSISVSAIAPNGTDSAEFDYQYSYSNNQGGSSAGADSGGFTFSAQTFYYVNGTDDQVGYATPVSLWFYLNNSLPDGGHAVLLNTPVTVQSTNETYQFPTDPTRYVSTLYVVGTGSYQRNDEYGVFTATYTWQAYFDPSTGYIVGYLYTEHDTDASGNGFTWTDTLSVTSTSYPLTAASPPPTSPASGSDDLLYLGIVAVVVVVVVVVAVVLSRRRRASLPRHSATGQVSFGRSASSPPPPPVGVAPPPIRLTPTDQPAVQQVVLRETVKVNCRYCGTLMDSTATVCPNCGAPRT